MAIEEVYMSNKRYTDEFKIEAVKQVLERGHSVREVAQRLGITTNSLCEWKRTFGQPDTLRRAELDHSAEVRRLKAEVKRLTEERDILKKAAAYFAKG
jgi:transposase